MRRNTGDYVRQRRYRTIKYGLLTCGALTGLPAGFLIATTVGALAEATWSMVALIAVTLPLCAVVLWLSEFGPWSLENLTKGVDAENKVGQILEYALTRDYCAIAHSVTSIATRGDIDHIVATPDGLWVVETKYRRVPKKRFSNVLAKLADNAASVQRWAPPGTPVQMVLVLAYEKGPTQPSAAAPGGASSVRIYNKSTLRHLAAELRLCAAAQRTTDPRLARKIWKLGQVDDPNN